MAFGILFGAAARVLLVRNPIDVERISDIFGFGFKLAFPGARSAYAARRARASGLDGRGSFFEDAEVALRLRAKVSRAFRRFVFY